MTNLFLRHAEVLNKKNIQYANLPGFQISDQGKEQSVAAGKLLKNSNKKIEKIISPNGQWIANPLTTAFCSIVCLPRANPNSPKQNATAIINNKLLNSILNFLE